MNVLNGYVVMSKSECGIYRPLFVSKNYYGFKIAEGIYNIPFHFFRQKHEVTVYLPHMSAEISQLMDTIDDYNKKISESILKNVTINRAIADKQLDGYNDIPYPNSTLTPMPHQKLAFNAAMLFDRYGLLMEMGLGKTKCALDLAQQRMIEGAHKWLVTCPLSVVSNWQREFNKNRVENVTCNFFNLRNKHQFQQFRECKGACIGVINWDSLFKLVDEPIDGFIVDESTKGKNHQAKRTKVAITIADKAKYCYILTGSIVTNNLWDVWSQYRIIDGGRAFKNSFYEFRAHYFQQHDEYTWIPKGGTKEDIRERLFCQAIVIKKEHCLNLPAKIYEVREVEFDEQEQAIYDKMKNECLLILQEKEITAQNVLSQITKLRQLASGFVYDQEHIPHRVTDKKIKELKEILDEIGEKKAIIWANYKEEIEWIMETLGEKAIALYGDTSSHAGSIVRDFLDGDKQYLVSNPATGGMGITLTPVDVVIYFSNPLSVEQRIQSEDRTHRVGMVGAVTYIDLCVKDTIDVSIKKSLEGKIKDAYKITDIHEITKFMEGREEE